jgi:protocatechuate 3,4-dioxygenase beta subunit
MTDQHEAHWTRRTFLRLCLALPAPLALAIHAPAALGRVAPGAGGPLLAPTPACGADSEATPRQTEGPYYRRNTPERTSLLEPGMAGTRLVLAGQVLSRACQPIAAALVDFWQTDANGAYDNAGYRMRGHQFTDEAGRYTLETVIPGLYPGRTRHIHVKVQAPNQPALTTQLYFPDEARNASDGIFRPALLLAMEDAEDGKRATFDFVLNV